ncbi:tRNA glutamyl-Q(34) synthetase GluQRS [Methyloradius palustris]|uniref:Glutamyl-Q tRNA(Asp) synthetase n=1 Tax=Methyloradius palustris TaxID=2778876 RepID=A0A8D5G7V0_9PROT|nr:tRNA glutamyl-Q(34) synthetase GluQRS [Methyloradius palustris]BCM24757.1 glutamyl-Q tRNA(Asp) synthetase [Methyloradius palustris]
MAHSALFTGLALSLQTWSYRGRFAPSPTGPLHFGSLVTAVASYLEAKSNNGQWLVRMEDIDTAREVPGAADDILFTLEQFGFRWDEAVIYQSKQHAEYAAALEKLVNSELVYPCCCSRKEIADSAMHGLDGLIYSGTCRNGALAKQGRKPAMRIKVPDSHISFIDALQGEIGQHLADEIGDFVLERADGFYAYQLAVVVDDEAQHITHVLRGADLIDSTPRQIYLQQVLGFATPHYTHTLIAVNVQGEKLSKTTQANPLDKTKPVLHLWQALDFLGQSPPQGLQTASLPTLWDWANSYWRISNVPALRHQIVRGF